MKKFRIEIISEIIDKLYQYISGIALRDWLHIHVYPCSPLFSTY